MYAWRINCLSFLITAGPYGWSHVYFADEGHVLPYSSPPFNPLYPISHVSKSPFPNPVLPLPKGSGQGIHQMISTPSF